MPERELEGLTALALRQVLPGALIYLAVVFSTGALLGPLRVVWLEPRLGPALAILCEAPFLLLAMAAGASWVAKRFSLRGQPRSLAAIGIIALVMQQCADLAVGVLLRTSTIGEQFAGFFTPRGLVYAALLIAFAAMPVLIDRTTAAVWQMDL